MTEEEEYENSNRWGVIIAGAFVATGIMLVYGMHKGDEVDRRPIVQHVNCVASRPREFSFVKPNGQTVKLVCSTPRP
jgi:hypothetical protein